MASGEKVFVSSTCHDLIDLRKEVFEHLRGMGLNPLASDLPLSDFEVDGIKDSIAQCLENVRSCDIFICILSQRYGPSLEKVGYGDISATHLEYREARRLKKRIYLYIRNRLETDYDQSVNHPDGPFKWLHDKKQFRLFEIIKEHKQWLREQPTTNWHQTFIDSVDLKHIISSHLRFTSIQALLEQLSDRDKLPTLSLKKGDHSSGNEGQNLNVLVYVYGKVPILSLSYGFEEGKPLRNLGNFDVGGHTGISHQEHDKSKKVLDFVVWFEYTIPLGHTIREVFRVTYDIPRQAFESNCFARRYISGPRFVLLGNEDPLPKPT